MYSSILHSTFIIKVHVIYIDNSYIPFYVNKTDSNGVISIVSIICFPIEMMVIRGSDTEFPKS